MCGLTGLIDFNTQISPEILNKMQGTLMHRGPDASGQVIHRFSHCQVGLAHQRLSILDLSQAGNQPMSFEHLTIVHNGEVYNFAQIQSELKAKGYSFNSHTDTEVILKAFHCWGVKCVDKFRGMFAFVILDEAKQKLFIFRDRAGVKPLYYSQQGKLFLFGSELKSLCAHPKFKKTLNHKAMPLYMRFGYIPAPLTIYEDTYKLKPGHVLEYDLAKDQYKTYCYWSVADSYQAPKLVTSETEALEELDKILQESFALRMVSDVPVGVFLSGGIDSSLVASMLAKQSNQPLNTFTIGFDTKGYDEAPFAKAIAAHIGATHTEHYCTKDDALGVVPKLAHLYDEPFADSSSIPTFLVSQLASQHVKVVLSGDGGDEAFCGYSKYFALQKALPWINRGWTKPVFKRVFGLLSEDVVAGLNGCLPGKYAQRNIRDKYQKLQRMLCAADPKSAFLQASSYLSDKERVALLKQSSCDFSETVWSDQYKLDPLDEAMCLDYQSFMVDDVLVKVDRATMGNSIEGREPLLDHRIIEYAARLPLLLKYNQGSGKYLLKKLLAQYVPSELFERPKAGFQVPLFEWLKTDLKPLCDHYLSETSLKQTGQWNVAAVRSVYQRYVSGRYTNVNQIWFVLMFQMWFEAWQ